MKPYRLGLCVAGAASAGTYSAGVLFELFTCLDRWERLRHTPLQLVLPDGQQLQLAAGELPSHRVSVDAFSGASAGSMCGALLLLGLAEGRYDKLHDLWVQQLDLLPLLELSDLKELPYSFFNMDFALQQALSCADFSRDASLPWPSYLPEQMDVYFSLANLQGVPYHLSADLVGVPNQLLQNYADYKRFTLCRPDSTASVPPDSTRLDPLDPDRSAWKELMRTCLASGAYPFGFSPMILQRRKQEYDQREWYFPDRQLPDQPPVPLYIPVAWAPDTPEQLHMEYTDGGVLNNEPFELVRRRLAINNGRWVNPVQGDKADAGVILIDPFPADLPDDYRYDVRERTLLEDMPAKVFGVMRNQTFFTPALLRTARRGDLYAAHLITPARYEQDRSVARMPLASGVLRHFGGLMEQSFREHDFALGRRNCHDFLKNYFRLPLTNPLVAYVSEQGLADRYQQLGWVTKDEAGNRYMQLIPLMPQQDDHYTPPAHPQWPQTDELRMQQVSQALRRRYARLLDAYMDKYLPKFGGGVLKGPLRWGVRRGLLHHFDHAWMPRMRQVLKEAGLL